MRKGFVQHSWDERPNELAVLHEILGPYHEDICQRDCFKFKLLTVKNNANVNLAYNWVE